jgi:hypothetical protein
MFGNWQGWIIALAIAAISVGLASQWFIVKGTEPERAVTAPGALALIEIENRPTMVYPQALSQPGNPGDEYARAVAIYEDPNNAREIFEWTEEYGRLSQLQQWDAIPAPPQPILDIANLIIEAAPKRDMEYMFVHTPRHLEVEYEILPANRLSQLAADKGSSDSHDALMYYLITYYARTGQYDQAVELAQATFMMGWHMFNERGHANMMAHGLLIQYQIIPRLQETYRLMGEPERADAIQPFRENTQNLWRVHGERQALIYANPPHVGNLLYAIDHEEDRAWRMQAILALGIAKFTSARPGDMRLLRERILELCEDPDPFIRAAAEAARDMTMADFRMSATPGNFILTDTRYIDARQDDESYDEPEPQDYPDEQPNTDIDDSDIWED